MAISDQDPIGAGLGKRPKKFYTTGEVAEMFGVTRKTVINWCERGRLPSVLTPGGQRRIPVSAFPLSPEEMAHREALKARLATKVTGLPVPTDGDIADEIRSRRQS